MTGAIYAPKSAARIDDAAKLIRRAASLLDRAGDGFVIAAIEQIPGSEAISPALATALEKLASTFDGEAA